MASCSFLCLFSLLLLAFAGHAVAAEPSTSTTAVAAEAPGRAGEVVAACWKSVMETPQSCARDILETLVFGTLHISKECCVVLGAVGEKCVVDVFSRIPLGQAYLPIVNRVCGLIPNVA